jgi:PIN domain
MNLFIDTNIYLTFYHYSSDDLEELKKLSVAIKSGEIVLYSTQQIRDEFRRNRESKIADALKRFSDQKLGAQFPQICKEYEEYQGLREAIRLYDEHKERILQKLLSDVETRNLGADKIISELFTKASNFDHEGPILEVARSRMERGNPPGKDGSLGDAINWETLLRKMPKQELFFITDDKDYMSQVDDTRLAEFLSDEWEGQKASKIFVYRKLSEFFRHKFPKIRLASEMEKELAISELARSGNFQRTHAAIANLSKFTDFTKDELNAIVDAAISNSQVYWIAEDADVKAFMQGLIVGREKFIDPEKLKTFKGYYAAPQDSEEPHDK